MLKPWHDLRLLKRADETWEHGFNMFLQRTSQHERDIIAGLQYYYEIKNVADSNRAQIIGENEESDLKDNVGDDDNNNVNEIRVNEGTSSDLLVSCDLNVFDMLYETILIPY